MSQEEKKKALGRGLSALLTKTYDDSSIASAALVASMGSPENVPPTEGLGFLEIKQIDANPLQPRLDIQEEQLEQLAESIREQGILQPIVVSKQGERYQIICGERRWRAAKLAGLEKIPAVIKEVASNRILELALVENIQREDLNPIEEALAYARLIDEQSLSQDEAAKRVGKNRSTVTNALRLLRLPREVQELISGGALTAGHARPLVALPSPEHQRVLGNRILKEQLSARQAEALVQSYLSGKRPAKRARKADPYVVDLENRLEHKLGTKVHIHHNKKNQGKIEIRYFSLDDLDRVLDALGVERS